jgi:hypothetical protein
MVNMHKRRPDERRAHATPVQKTARVAAIVLGLLGILGFIPGITAEYGQLEVTGIGADAILFGLLPVTITHNVLMLLFAAGIYAAAQRSAGATKATLIGLGLFNVACAAYGLINVRYGSTLWVPAGEVDNWFHLVLGAVLFALGLIRGPKYLDPRRP